MTYTGLRVRACGIKLSFGSRVVLDDWSAEFLPCETVALTGPSGSGKTTLLGILGGMVRPDSGEVHVDGPERRGRNGAGPLLAGVAWVNQRSVGVARRRAWEVAGLVPLLSGKPDRWVRDLVAMKFADLGLIEVFDRPYGQLSGGERQRVCVARALLSGRPIVLADEPTAGLDAVAASSVADALVSGNSDQIVVIATHDVAVAARCHRRIDLRQKREQP